MSYVVAFNGRRDSYQVPLALHEKRLLARLVTDVYYSDDPVVRRTPWMRRFRHRRIEGLPSSLTRSDWYATALQILGPRAIGPLLGLGQYKLFKVVDDHLSRVALKLARRADADLFLYSGYAYEAFVKSVDRRKGLFLYHPHHRLVREILLADYGKYPECRWSMQQEQEVALSPEKLTKFDREIELADFVVCASSFVKRSLLRMGCSESKIRVVPYGTDVTRPYQAKDNDVCRFLFLGQGVQRKGLHHLFRVWRSVKLPDARLTVIAYAIDPEIARQCPEDVELLPAQSAEALFDHYARSHIFVMPSLIEGFGHVYLEAMSMGCFVIGTENTGLPDLRAPSWAAAYTAAGDLDHLASIVQAVYERHRKRAIPHAEIRRYAEAHFHWSTFREKIAEIAAAMAHRMADEEDERMLAAERAGS